MSSLFAINWTIPPGELYNTVNENSAYIAFTVDRLPKGYVFTYENFTIEVDKKEAVIKALNRMVIAGKLSKLSKGKYYKPETTPFGSLMPDQKQIVRDLLEEDRKTTGYLTGYSIYNQLGLTTQVSNTIQIGKNERRPNFKRERYTISFINQKNTITKENIPLLQILDAIRYIKKIPDTTIESACRRLLAIIESLSPKDKSTLVRLAQKYPPATRSLLGAMLNEQAEFTLSELLRRSLNPITKFRLPAAENRPQCGTLEYCMKLHENKTLFRQAVQFTSDKLKIAAIYVEKDYWVTYALKIIFQDEIGKDTVFKGGTALSKCNRLIKRFSEDIDLVVLKREGEAGNQLTKKIRRISNVVSNELPEVDTATVTRKMGMNRKTAHIYNKEFEGGYGQIRDVIVVEATWFGYFEPFTTRQLNSFVGEMMIETGQEKLAEEYEMLAFEVRVLKPVRTICEKIMSLVRFSHTENPIVDLRNKIRHCYDLHQLLRQDEFAKFFESDDFAEMLLKVADDDMPKF